MNVAAPYKWPQRFTPAIGIVILLILYVVGIVGIILPVHEQFILLTPLNLLVSTAIIFYFHPRWKTTTYRYLVLAYLVGFAAEVFGVQTGILFGDYNYGKVLGPKMWDTPFMIGINWMMLGYCAGIIANVLLKYHHWFWRGFLAALLMVGLDVFIEPVAIAYDFWQWEGNEIPLRNYIGWFIVALPLECYFVYGHKNTRNKVAISLFLLQLFFFLVLNINLWIR